MDKTLRTYAELAVNVGLNLRAGQRLLIIGPVAIGGVSLEAAPLVRAITECADEAGASLVEAMWGDETMHVARFQLAPRESFGEFSAWLPGALEKHVGAGHAIMSVYANDPELLKDQDTQLIGMVQQAASQAVRAFREQISRNETNWTVVATPGAGWAARVFPGLPPADRTRRLWEAIARLCRLDAPDPVAAWRAHLAALASRRDTLNAKRFDALRYKGPGTDLTVGLPSDHRWVSGTSVSRNGIEFAPNLPTEEVFTMPHKDRVNGRVRSTKPLSHGSTLIEGFSLRFEDGRIVDLSAERGESVLRQLVETDAGAARLGELALVPHSSPISQSGLLFYNTLFDENAASHLALGSAYKFTMRGGEDMTTEQFEQAGGNRSGVHVDFMIGSGELDVDGILADGRAVPLIRRGDFTLS